MTAGRTDTAAASSPAASPRPPVLTAPDLSRLRAGEVLVRNPYRPVQLLRVRLSPAVVDAFVFWS